MRHSAANNNSDPRQGDGQTNRPDNQFVFPIGSGSMLIDVFASAATGICMQTVEDRLGLASTIFRQILSPHRPHRDVTAA